LDTMTVVMGIMFLTNGQFLIARRPDAKMHGGLWEFPGGKLQVNETAEQALCREFSEELDIQIQNVQALDEYAFEHEGLNIRFLPFKGRLPHPEIRLLEHQQAAFINVTELDLYAFAPPDYEIVRRLKQGQIPPP